jgi:hypothetical protein
MPDPTEHPDPTRPRDPEAEAEAAAERLADFGPWEDR